MRAVDGGGGVGEDDDGIRAQRRGVRSCDRRDRRGKTGRAEERRQSGKVISRHVIA